MAKPTKTSPAGILRQLDRSINATRKELDGLVAARDAISGVILSNARTPRVTQIHGSRSQMIRTILNNAPGPVTVDEIAAEMATRGRHDARANIQSTLSALKRTSQVKNVERGKWQSVTEVQQQVAA